MADTRHRIGRQIALKPVGLRTDFGGLYRGEIAAVDTDSLVRRYRVRVHGIHPADIPDDHCPLADVSCMMGGKLWGDFASFEKNDLVFVMFEDADRDLPVIMGAWLSESLGVPDLPAELAEDYAAGAGRWVRVDRAGNVVELSTVEQWVRLVSGAAQVVVSQQDGSVSLRGDVTGRESTIGQDVITFWQCSTGETIIDATKLDTLGGPAGIVTITANLNIEVQASNRTRIGVSVPRFLGVPVPTGVPGGGSRVSTTTIVAGTQVVVGTSETHTEDALPVSPTVQVSVNGVTVSLSSTVGGVSITATGGNVSITSTNKVTATAPEVDITAATIKLVGAVTVTGDVGVTGNVTASGEVSAANGAVGLLTHTHLYSPGPGSPMPTATGLG